MEAFNRPIYVGRLSAFIAPTQEQHAGPAQQRVLRPISRPSVDPKFGYSVAQRFAIAEVPKRKPVNPRSNSRSHTDVQTCQPVADQIFSCSGDVPTNLNHALVYLISYNRASPNRTPKRATCWSIFWHLRSASPQALPQSR